MSASVRTVECRANFNVKTLYKGCETLVHLKPLLSDDKMTILLKSEKRIFLVRLGSNNLLFGFAVSVLALAQAYIQLKSCWVVG